MDDDNGFDLRSWCYYDQPVRSNAGLQLMSTYNATERDTKNLLSNAQLLRRSYGVPDDMISTDYVRDVFMPQSSMIMQALPLNYSHPNYSCSGLCETPVTQTFQMLQPPESSKEDTPTPLQIVEFNAKNEASSKKRSPGKSCKSPKPKKPKKVTAPKGGATNGLVSRGRLVRKCIEVVINGIDLDISRIPTPVCTCTGAPQQCYRWGAGGWQSACCTTSISLFPLPMSTKRRGARIAGRKMSQGAFKKVLDKLAGEGYNLSNPIDLKTYWAKHGTNKFVTIR